MTRLPVVTVAVVLLLAYATGGLAAAVLAGVALALGVGLLAFALRS